MMLRRAAAAVSAMVLVALGAVATGAPAIGAPEDPPAPPTVAAVVDPPTYHAFPGSAPDDVQELADEAVGFDGRIWTDKTVFRDSMPDHDGQQAEPFTLDANQFGVALSALGSTRHLVSETKVPIDVVLVLDISGSMRLCLDQTGAEPGGTFCAGRENYTSSRAQAMVDAVNDAIDIITADNPANRVAIVAFNRTASTLQALGTPQKIPGTDEYVRLTRGGYVALQSAGPQGTTAAPIDFGTNTQAGIAMGMNLLASQDPDAVTGSQQRLPSVVLLSDGEPTLSATAEEWWSPTEEYQGTSGTNIWQNYGSGLKAVMAAAYLKNKIGAVYHHDSNEFPGAPRVFTIGFGIDGLTKNGKSLADATLDPSHRLDVTDDRTARVFSATFAEYHAGGAPIVDVTPDMTYTITHPTGDAALHEVTDLKYNDAFYPTATRDDLVNAFTDIAKTITDAAPNPPTEIEPGRPDRSGYVTFTDRLGQFMEVGRMDTLTFCAVPEGDPAPCTPTVFGDPARTEEATAGGSTVTYTFHGSYAANGIYGSADVSKLAITVRKSADPAVGDTVTVRIPSTLLPVQDTRITQNAQGDPIGTVTTAAHPVHLFYVVQPKAGVLENLADPYALNAVYEGAGDALAAYVDQHAGPDGVRFYANHYGGDAGVDATASAEFTPARTNEFYRLAKQTTVYGDAELTQPITAQAWQDLSPSAEVHYAVDGYRRATEASPAPGRVSVTLRTTKERLASVAVDVDGVMAVPAGTLDRSSRPENLDHAKCAGVRWAQDVPACVELASTHNATGTADWTRATAVVGQAVSVSLGNNGLLAVPVPGRLVIGKSVVGGSALNPDPATTFSFTVGLAGSVRAGDVFPYAVYEGAARTNPVRVATIVAGGSLSLTSGQVAVIGGLPDGAAYTVTEATPPPGFELTSPSPVTGTVAAGAEGRAVFTNTYGPQSVTQAAPSVRKTLANDAGAADLSFTARLCPPVGTVCETVAVKPGQSAVFADQTFDTPGTFIYTISEVAGQTPGVRYSNAEYSWVVTVVDNGRGALEVAGTALTRVRGDDGAPIVPPIPVGDQVAVLTNGYDVDSTTISLPATKIVNDTTWSPAQQRAPWLTHPFRFWTIGSSAGAVPPTFGDTGLSEVRVGNLPGSRIVLSPPLTFEQGHLGQTYYYAAQEAADTVPPGFTLDTAVHIYRVVVSQPSQEEGPVQAVVAVTRCVTAPEAITDDTPRGTCAEDADFTDEDAVFTNTYTATPAKAALAGTKALTGRPWAASDRFVFELTTDDPTTAQAIADGDITMPAVTTAAVDPGQVDPVTGAAPFTFGEITFATQGYYRFAVAEQGPAAPGVSGDGHVARYTVEVTDDEGALTATVTPDDGIGAPDFVNRYTSTWGGWHAQVVKTLTGRDQRAGEFTFRVVPGDEAAARVANLPPQGRTFTNADAAANGEPSVTDVLAASFTNADDGATYCYEISEEAGRTDARVVLDTTVHTLCVTVADDGAGTLSSTTTVTGVRDGRVVTQQTTSASAADPRPAWPQVSFTNVYEPPSGRCTPAQPCAPTPAPGPARPLGYLPRTGAQVLDPLLGGLGMVAIGLILVTARRRRTRGRR